MLVAGCYAPGVKVSVQDVEFGLVVNHEEWFALPYQWIAPAQRSLKERSRRDGILARSTGDECSLLEASARNAFGSIPVSGLKKIASLVGVAAASNSTFDVLYALIKFVIPAASEDEVLTIMSRRCKKEDPPDDILHNETLVKECFDKSDAEETEKHTKPKVKTEDDREFLRKWGKARKLSTSSVGGGSKRRGSSTASSSRGSTHIGINRSYPRKVPTKIEAAEVQGLLPPACTAWIDRLENRVRARYDCVESISRSWAVRGEEQALRMVVEWAWDLHKSLTGEDCPMKDLVSGE